MWQIWILDRQLDCLNTFEIPHNVFVCVCPQFVDFVLMFAQTVVKAAGNIWTDS